MKTISHEHQKKTRSRNAQSLTPFMQAALLFMGRRTQGEHCYGLSNRAKLVRAKRMAHILVRHHQVVAGAA